MQEGPWFTEDPKQSAENRRLQYLKYLEMAGKGILFVCITMENKKNAKHQNVNLAHFVIINFFFPERKGSIKNY